MINFFKKNRIKIFIFIMLLLLSFWLPQNYIFAADDQGLSGFLGESTGKWTGAIAGVVFIPVVFIINVFVWMIGVVSMLFTNILFAVATYSDFINEEVVVTSWVMVRDLCNMFFVLILLIIAFATILRVDRYELKKALPKLLIMAVLINFSKTICGLFIDFSQIIMLTFIDPLKHGHLIDALGMEQMFTFSSAFSIAGSGLLDALTPDALQELLKIKTVNPITTVGSMIFGLILLTIACIVIITYTMVLFFRIVTLWVLIILSPIAYVMSAFPDGQKYASRWWSEFSKAVIAGPATAFFIWLAIIASQSAEAMGTKIGLKDALTKDNESWTGNFTSALLNEIVDIQHVGAMLKYMIVIAILTLGLKMSQEAGGAIGDMASRGLDRVKKAPGMIGNSMWGSAKFGGRHTAGRLLRSDKFGNANLGKLNPVKELIHNYSKDSYSSVNKKSKGNWQKRLEKIGMGEDSMHALHSLLTKDDESGTGKRVARGFVGDFITGNLAGGAQKGFKDIKNANEMRIGQHAPTTPQLDVSSFATQNVVKHLLSGLKTDNAAAGKIATDISAPGATEKFVQGWAKALAGYEKAGNTIDGNLSNIRSAVEGTSHVSSIDDYKTTVYPSYMMLKKNVAEATAKGDGEFRVGSFGRGTSNQIQVDLDSLGVDELKPKGHANFKGVAGMNIEDGGQINKVASNLLDAINNKVAGLKSSGATTENSAELRGLVGAQDRLKDTNSLNNLQLVNTGVSRKNRREAIAHETIHGSGILDEGATDTLTKQAMGGGGIAGYRRASLARNKTPDEILSNESLSKNKIEQEINVVAEIPEIKELSSALKDLNVGNSHSSGMSSVNMDNSIRYIGGLLSGIKGGVTALGKKGTNVQKITKGITDDATSLEVKVTAEVLDKLNKRT